MNSELTSQGLYNSYYGGERPPPSSSRDSHRRSLEQGSFLPPPPPPQPGQPSGSNLTLPPVSATYSGGPGGYHGSSPSTAPMSSTSSAPTSAGLSQHLPPSMVYSNHGMSVSSQPMSAYHYPLQSSPASMSAFPPSTARPHGYSPRMSGGYPSASPGMTTLSPLSPSTHMQYQPPSSSGTSSSFPSVPPSHSKMDMSDLRKQARRTHSASGSSSWDDRKEGDDDQPWGMPQEQYKALNPKDKKQVRNRIGARRFRAKRKGNQRKDNQTDPRLRYAIRTSQEGG